MSVSHIFVYGSLQKVFEDKNEYTRLFHSMTSYVQKGIVKGTLYMVDWYPGLLLNGNTPIHGELYLINHPDLLFLMDEYENAIEENLTSTVDVNSYDYLRKEVLVNNIPAWVYEYRRDVNQDKLIANGNFIKTHYGLE
ncbi:MAG: gamma-glutamylcyclotransferase family protein [Cytophagaceae bacterium]